MRRNYTGTRLSGSSVIQSCSGFPKPNGVTGITDKPPKGDPPGCSPAPRQPGHAHQIAKVFWFFFSKKNKPPCYPRTRKGSGSGPSGTGIPTGGSSTGTGASGGGISDGGMVGGGGGLSDIHGERGEAVPVRHGRMRAMPHPA